MPPKDANAFAGPEPCSLETVEMPVSRRHAIELLVPANEPLSTTQIATELGLPNPTTHRVLQDLAAHAIVRRLPQGEGLADLWEARAATRERHAIATSSEKSGTPLSKNPEYTFDDISEEVGPEGTDQRLNGRQAISEPSEVVGPKTPREASA